MSKFVFRPRYAIREATDPSLEWLQEIILNPCKPEREFGEAIIDFSDGARKVRMILIHDQTLGYYLKIGPDPVWLSLGDRSRLGEVVCPDDWNFSAGLCIAPEKAWVAIREFCVSGNRANEIDWISPAEIPIDGNY